MFNEVEKEIHGNMPRYLETLMDLVRIPSISFDNFDQKFVIQSADQGKHKYRCEACDGSTDQSGYHSLVILL